MEHNMVGWFEIPVTNMDRAMDFYGNVLGIDLKLADFGGLKMAWFPMDPSKPGSGGSLIQHETSYTPSDSAGVLIYFSVPDMERALERVALKGGTVLKTKTQISEDIGYMGLFLDTEGNRIALHSQH